MNRGVRKGLPYLRLVEGAERTELSVRKKTEPLESATQTSFFSDADSQTLAFISASEMDASKLLEMLTGVKPKYIFDLRSVPTFSGGKITRRSIFSLFDALKIQYFDVSGAVGISSSRDAILNPKLLIPKILESILRGRVAVEGPALFFVDAERMTEEFISGVANEFPSVDRRGWEISVWQQDRQHPIDFEKRDLVFVSHANPEDNDIARWFVTRLASEGFNVWSDITRLIGGEVFWDTIEDAIRNRAARVVVLLSKKGHEKPGVLDEVNVAVSTERLLSAKGFVIPVRIDDLEFSEIRANIARKNVIDGKSELKSALKEVVKALDEAGVPRRDSHESEILSSWISNHDPRFNPPEPSNWDQLIQNKIDILSWPSSVRKVSGLRSGNLLDRGISEQHVVLAPASSGTLTFASDQELREAFPHVSRIVRRAEAVTQSVISGEAADIFGDEPIVLRNSLSAMVREAWNTKCRKEELLEYQLSSNRSCWYFPDQFAPKNKVSFSDHRQKQRTRALVGRSEAKNAFWHFGVEAKVFIGDESIRLKPHVIFSEDGQTPIESHARQHSLRRSFCKSWWNDRWRDLLNAFLNHLSDGKPEWDWPVSPSRSIKVSGRLGELSTNDSTNDSEHFGYLQEPSVEVGFNQKILDPREGLMLFGPVDFDRNPTEIRIGVIGSQEGIDLFHRWCAAFRKATTLTDQQKEKREIPFPGFEAVFGAKWPQNPAVTIPISRTDLLNAVRMRDRHQAVHKSVGLFVDQIARSTKDDDAQVDIWFVVIPDEVYLYGRPNSRVPSAISLAPTSGITKKLARKFAGDSPSLFSEDNEGAKIYEHHADFHNQLKARLLRSHAITQILRESSIIKVLEPLQTEPSKDDVDETGEHDLSRRMQDPSNVAWNLGTASFFKAGGRPWKVASAREGVCYVGLIFKRDELGRSGHACCGAQLFLDSGEGLVFKGAMGPWYSAKTHQYHLSKLEAEKLMGKILEAYKGIHGAYPDEVFVHGRTRFSTDELLGFSEASHGKSTVIGVRITRTNDFKLFASAHLPVKRGSFLKLNDRIGLVWTSGFVEALNTYQGRETPNPLRVEICGSFPAKIETVLADIMTLTKMNFNSATFADGYPVTMRFADAIGDVLMATGDRDLPPLPFRHYI